MGEGLYTCTIVDFFFSKQRVVLFCLIPANVLCSRYIDIGQVAAHYRCPGRTKPAQIAAQPTKFNLKTQYACYTVLSACQPNFCNAND